MKYAKKPIAIVRSPGMTAEQILTLAQEIAPLMGFADGHLRALSIVVYNSEKVVVFKLGLVESQALLEAGIKQVDENPEYPSVSIEWVAENEIEALKGEL